jgi:aryl-alcohol dehydrogenase-like predicted oxidoreductase
MRYRVYPRTGWELSEVGYGMWGLGGWTGSDDEQTLRSLSEAVALGCNFFDTAWAYGAGHSERLLAQTLRAHRDRRLYVATKVPPKNQRWIQLDDCALDDVFPADHIRHYTEASLDNLGVDTIDLQQLHAWSDRWADDDRWQRVVDDLRREGLVQVVYNIFDQDPEDQLFPYCLDRGISVIARVPFDEGSLTGTLTRDTRFPDGDWRNLYFTPDRLAAMIDRVDRLEPHVPATMTLPELALRFILHHPAVTTTIPGMRRLSHVRANCAVSDGVPLDPHLLGQLRHHRWRRDWVVP